MKKSIISMMLCWGLILTFSGCKKEPAAINPVTVSAADKTISGVKLPAPITYTSFQGSVSTLQPWFGKHFVLLTPSSELDSKTMAEILKSLDGGYKYYQSATGREPVKWDPYTIDGRGTIASVETTCGGACGYLGYTGIEMIHPWVTELYNDVKDRGVHHTTLFYEIGRNFWFYSEKLAYPVGFKMNISTGYSELMKYMATDYIKLPLRPLEASSRADLETFAFIYLAATDWNWLRVIETGDIPFRDNQIRTGGAHELFASLMLNLQKQYGGHAFIEGFLKEADKRPSTSSAQDAIDNMAIGISAGAKENLSDLLINGWRIPISQGVQAEARGRFGEPVK